MRYVANKIQIVKIVDQQISDVDLIKDILNFIKQKELDCSMRFKDQYSFDKVRISEVGDDIIKFDIIKSAACLKKTAKISDLAYLELTTEDRILNNFKPGITRWSLLGTDDIDSDIDS